MHRLLVCLALGTFAACSSAKPAAHATAAPEEKDAKDIGEGISFDDKSHDQQIAYMKLKVVPHMGKLLTEHDPEEFAEVTCVTCHGPGAKDGEFHMPTDSLPKLNPTDGFAAHQEDYSEMLKFMGEVVVPEMAALIDEEPYNPATQTGFGCFDCHLKAE